MNQSLVSCYAVNIRTADHEDMKMRCSAVPWRHSGLRTYQPFLPSNSIHFQTHPTDSISTTGEMSRKQMLYAPLLIEFLTHQSLSA